MGAAVDLDEGLARTRVDHRVDPFADTEGGLAERAGLAVLRPVAPGGGFLPSGLFPIGLDEDSEQPAYQNHQE